MLCYVLMCIIPFVSLFGKDQVYATNFQPAATFSNDFLKVSDFDDILEHESNEESQPSILRIRDTKNIMEDSPLNNRCEKCPHCLGCPGDTSGQKKIDVDKVKRELGKAGADFLKKFFASEEESKEKDSEEGKEKADASEGQDKDLAKDEEFQVQQEQAANLTNVTKTFLYDIEHPPPENETECCEKDEEEKDDKKQNPKPHPKFAKSPRKSTAGLLDDVLEMHFYKQSAEAERNSFRKKKSLLLNMHTREANNKKSVKAPKKFNYIALLAKNKDLVQVPALKFAVVPEDNRRRRRRSDIFEPFFVSKYRKPARRFKSKPTNNACCRPHVPILFVNTVPGLRNQYKNDAFKRSPNISENCVRDAELMIQDVTNYLKFNLVDNRKTMPVDAGILVNSKSSDALANKDTNSEKNVFKKETKEEPVSNLKQDEAEVEEGPSLCNEPEKMKNSLKSMAVAPNRENNLDEIDV